MAFNCIIQNFLGTSFTADNQIRVNGDEGSTFASFYIQDGSATQRVSIASSSSIRDYIVGLGFTDAEITNWDWTGDWNISFKFEDDTVVTHSLQTYGHFIGLDNLQSRLVDYWFDIPPGATITFTSGGAVNQHNIVFQTNDPDLNLTTLSDLQNLLLQTGITPTTTVYDASPVISCVSTSGGGSSTSVVIGSNINPTQVINSITERTALEAQILETYYQAHQDEVAGSLDVEATNTTLIDLYQQLATV